MSLDIRVKRIDRIYTPGDVVSGVVVVSSKGALSHEGITLVVEGNVALQLSAKSVGLFEAFYNSVKPLNLISYTIQIAPPGKLPDGTTELPFEFPLKALPGQSLFETYHGVFVNVQYMITCDMVRGFLHKNLKKQFEIIVQVPGQSPGAPRSAVPFTISPETLKNVKKSSISSIPTFLITGKLDTVVCDIGTPLLGEIKVESSELKIRSIDLQLVRVETCASADSSAKEATEIQNLQISEGDVCRDITIPIHMIFPRLFTCPTLITKTFRVEFEVNVVVVLENGLQLTENFPLKIFRK